MGDYSKIPTDKLKKIHYTQLKIIEKRKQSGQLQGVEIKEKKITEIIPKLSELLKDLFTHVEPGNNEDLIGLRYYVAVLEALPLYKVEALEYETQRELKKRKEIYRQSIDAGNIEKVVRGENHAKCDKPIKDRD